VTMDRAGWWEQPKRMEAEQEGAPVSRKGGCVMRTASLVFAALTAAALLGAAPAGAECIRELPSKRTEYWAYRLVNGQKCWYPAGARGAPQRKMERNVLAAEPAPRPTRSRRGQVIQAPELAAGDSEPADAFAEAWKERVAATDDRLATGSQRTAAPNDRVTPAG